MKNQELDSRQTERFVSRTNLDRLHLWNDGVYKPFGGSLDIRYDIHGNLYYCTTRSSRQIEESPSKFIYIAADGSPSDPSRTNVRQRTTIVNCTHTLENAYRAAGHVLDDTDREKTRLSAVSALAEKWSWRWLIDFPSQTPEEFKIAKKEAIDQIRKSGRDPYRAIDTEKREMYRLLLKGISGRNSLNQLSRMISKIALDAVIADVRLGLTHVDETLVKFFSIRNVCMLERVSYHTILSETIENLKYHSSVLYRSPEEKGRAIASLSSDLSRLDSLVVNPYLSLAIEAKQNIRQLLNAIHENRPTEDTKIICSTIQKTLDETEEALHKESKHHPRSLLSVPVK